MKKLFVAVVVGAAVLRTASAALFMEDAITNAAVGANLGSAAPWGNSSAQVKVAAGNLTNATLSSPAPAGNMVYLLGSAGGSSSRSFTGSAVSSGSVYYSFLVQCTNLPTASSLYLTGLLPSGTTSPGGSSDPLAVYTKSNGLGGYQLGIRKSGAAITNAATALALDTTYLVVAKYAFGPGAGDDVVSLYLNPTPGAPEPASPDATQTGGTDAADLQNVYFKSSGSYGNWNFDTLRIGSNWADVTPSAGGGTPSGTNQPYITQALMSASGLVLRGTNGLAAGVYQVLASSNASLPVPQWPAIGTNVFDTNGNFDCTNPVSPANIQQFYRLLVGGQVVPPPLAPSITNQPASLSVTTGQSAQFFVGASGTSPLYYQWYFNTNTPLADKTNATLILNSVTTNNAGRYSVTVTNVAGSVSSDFALLTVSPAPVGPSITSQPTNQTVFAGQGATFTVLADGTAPLRYQWYFNTNTALAGATNATLTITNAQGANAGGYSVRVTNSVGSVTSVVATLTVLAPPTITTQPSGQSVTVSNNATFTVIADGTVPLRYQWYFNTNTVLASATNSSLTITNVQPTNAGGYSVVVTNNYGSATSVVAMLTVNTNTAGLPDFGLYGFAQATTGGGIVAETSAAYRKVTNALDLANAIDSATVKVIEITTNLDLGWNEIGAAAQAVGPFRAQGKGPLLHPRLLVTGVSLLDIQGKNGLTIFSANGSTIRHCCFNIKAAQNIIVRNLKFDEMWEWDEASSTPGDYDRNDWDFIDLGNGGGTGTTTNIWIDHCTFTKAYDGICDIKGGANHITFSWNKYVGDDSATNSNSFVWQQINSLESNKTAYAMYNSLRTSSGFTPAEIVTIIQGHDKTHLAGANSGVGNANNAAENALISITFHHQWFQNCWDRCVPRLRGGNVHNYNIYVDDTQALAAKRLRDQHTVSSSYSFNPFLNGSISTESGAILLEKSVYENCITPLRNNQTDTNNPAYTGKIMAIDSIYHFDNTNGTSIDYRGDSTNAPGSTYFGPTQAPVIPFSWNLPGNVLPYSYTPDDPSQLLTLVSNYCGAGALTWAKTNWLKTSY